MSEDTDGSTGREGAGRGGSQFLAPISGLLSIVFAVMAGASLSYALGRPPQYLLVPAVLAAASVGSVYLKRQLDAAGGASGDGDDGNAVDGDGTDGEVEGTERREEDS